VVRVLEQPHPQWHILRSIQLTLAGPSAFRQRWLQSIRRYMFPNGPEVVRAIAREQYCQVRTGHGNVDLSHHAPSQSAGHDVVSSNLQLRMIPRAYGPREPQHRLTIPILQIPQTSFTAERPSSCSVFADTHSHHVDPTFRHQKQLNHMIFLLDLKSLWMGSDLPISNEACGEARRSLTLASIMDTVHPGYAL